MSNAVQRMGLEARDSQAQRRSSMTLPNSTGMHCDLLKRRTSTKLKFGKYGKMIVPKGLRKLTIQTQRGKNEKKIQVGRGGEKNKTNAGSKKEKP